MSTPQVGLIFTTDAGTTEINPVFKVGDKVYVKTEYPDTGNPDFKYNPYSVVGIVLKSDPAGSDDVVGADGTTIADSTVAADLSTTDEDVTNDTNVLFPWFYRISNAATSAVSEYHETNLKTLAGVKARIDAANDNWADPA